MEVAAEREANRHLPVQTGSTLGEDCYQASAHSLKIDRRVR